jgi:CheY-like chemotaxis protein
MERIAAAHHRGRSLHHLPHVWHADACPDRRMFGDERIVWAWRYGETLPVGGRLARRLLQSTTHIDLNREAMTNDAAHATQVLVIEDDADIRDYVQWLLEDAGYRVLLAPHGAAALDALQQAPRLPDVILLDLQMPILDGRAFRRHQLADPRWQTIPVILMSASGDPAIAAQELQIATVLRKPFVPDALLAAIAAA